MRRGYEVPKITKLKDKAHAGGERYEHPAFGVIQLTNIHGGSETLFGSDVGHSDRVRISLHKADLTRDLSRDWIHSDLTSLIEFEMSHAQFAQFVMSVGKGEGTPVTLRSLSGSERIPGIVKEESKYDLHRREIGDAANRRIEDAMAVIKSFGDTVATGKLKISEAREFHKTLDRLIGCLPSSLKFVVGQAEEALEKATSDAKIEVEAFIDSRAKQLGLSRIEELAQLASESNRQNLEKL